MAKFKVGDRVRVIDKNHPEYGKVGVCIEDATSPWVAFDSPTEYGGSTSHRDGWVAGHMDCLDSHQLRTVASVSAAIAAYTRACEAFEASQLQVEKAKQDVVDARLNLRDALDGEA